MIDQLARIASSSNDPPASTSTLPPRPRRRTDDEDIADSLESMFRTKFGDVPVVAAVEIARMRRRGTS